MAPKQSTLAGGASGTAAAAEGLVSPRATDGGKLLYAVRGGPHQGVYDRWHMALDAGFKYKQGVGNGASFSKSEREIAEKWASDLSKMQPEAKAAQLQKIIKDQHILIRLLVVVIIFTVVFFIVHFFVECIGHWYGCSEKIMKTHPVCLGNMKVDLFMSENAAALQTLVFTEMLAVMAAFFVWLVGCIA
ncbi:hypothetical protein CYMTET_5960 [Cymbomonas tetramitiformis]|uniref:Uncharacterized protein n=1 Tax=Cymbomonas tetramitiformis TaxID=36881 RepID=A0AAE0GY67_9CHLO|nr:hypothetical protein CYMTET_5960 [Cymbomonas tetramitiformis]